MNRNSLAAALSLSALAACSDGGGSGSPNGEVPASLVDIESAGEDAYDRALLEDYAAVAAAADLLDEDWAALREAGTVDDAPANALADLDSAIAALATAARNPVDAATVARAANAVSAPMDELFGLFEPTVPSDVLALDYLGREIVLDGMQADLDAAVGHVDVVQSTWDGLRTKVVEAGGSRETQDYEASIDAMRADIAAGDAAQLIVDANAGLELVDAIEGVFGG